MGMMYYIIEYQYINNVVGCSQTERRIISYYNNMIIFNIIFLADARPSAHT